MTIFADPVEASELYINPKYKHKRLLIGTNEGHLPTELVGWLKPFSADTPDEVLRHELNTKGFVHIKQVMPREYVLDVRRRFFQRVASTGVLKEGTQPVEGIFRGGDPTPYAWPVVKEQNTLNVEDFAREDEYAYLAAKMHYEEWTNAFSGNQYLTAMMARLHPEWTSPHVVRRQIFRTNIPYAETATSVHYDQLFFRYAPPTAVTVWVPIGDCPPENGGLMYLENSKDLGQEIEDRYTKMSEEKGLSYDEKNSARNVNMTEKSGLAFDAGKFALQHGRGRKWLLGDYEAGDAVFHHMYAIHASGLNHDVSGRIRFSADLRYVDKDQPYDHRWDGVFYPGDKL